MDFEAIEGLHGSRDIAFEHASSLGECHQDDVIQSYLSASGDPLEMHHDLFVWFQICWPMKLPGKDRAACDQAKHDLPVSRDLDRAGGLLRMFVIERFQPRVFPGTCQTNAMNRHAETLSTNNGL